MYLEVRADLAAERDTLQDKLLSDIVAGGGITVVSVINPYAGAEVIKLIKQSFKIGSQTVAHLYGTRYSDIKVPAPCVAPALKAVRDKRYILLMVIVIQ